MNEVFRPQRKVLIESASCTVFFAAMAVFSVFALPHTPDSLYFIGWFAAFWMFWLALALHGVAAYFREELHVNGSRICFRGVFRALTLDLTTVTRAIWRRGANGAVSLQADGQRLTIRFHFDGSPRLIEHLQSRMPQEIQFDWPRFRQNHLVPRVVGPDDVLVNRKRMDRYLIPGALVCLVFALASAACKQIEGTVAGCLSAALLFGMRYMVSKEGSHSASMRASFRGMPELLWMIGFQLLALVIFFAYMAAERWFHLVLPFRLQAAALAIYGVGSIATMAWTARCDSIREKKRKAELEAEWNAERPSV